jgi:outer membrane protein W
MSRVSLLLLALLLAWPSIGDAQKKKRKRGVYVRGVVAYVAPRITMDNAQIDPSAIAAQAVGDGQIDSTGIAAGSSMRPTAIVGYVMPRTRGRLSVETMLGVPVNMKIGVTGKLANESFAPDAAGTPTGIPPLGPDLGEATVVPPMVTALYRPVQIGRVSLLVGGGASVLFVYDERVTNSVLTEVSAPDMSISHTLGFVAQAGIEARLWRRLVARLDAKYISYRASHATIDNIQVRTQLPLLPSVDVGNARMDITAHPVIVQVGVGADF